MRMLVSLIKGKLKLFHHNICYPVYITRAGFCVSSETNAIQHTHTHTCTHTHAHTHAHTHTPTHTHPCTHARTHTHSFKYYSVSVSMHVIQSALHVVQVGYGYLLMLVVMTFNGWLFLAVCFGAGVGYLLFAKSRHLMGNFREQNEHCH